MPFHQILPSPSIALLFSNELNEGHHDHERLLTSLLFKAVVSVTNKLLQNGGQSLYEVGYLNFVSLLDTYVICMHYQKFPKIFYGDKKKWRFHEGFDLICDTIITTQPNQQYVFHYVRRMEKMLHHCCNVDLWCHRIPEKVQSNLAIRNFLVALKLFLNAKSSLSL